MGIVSEAPATSIKGVYDANSAVAAWDVLQHSLEQFTYDHKMEQPVLIASIRKASTHLVRNLGAHFVGLPRVEWDFIYDEALRFNMQKFKAEIGVEKFLYLGHIERGWAANALFRNAKVILVVRDPYTQALSRALHFLHPDTTDPFSTSLQEANVPLEEAIYHAIYGVDYRGWKHSSLVQDYKDIAMAWLDRADVVLRHEDITRGDAASERALMDCARKMGWGEVERFEERVRAAMAPEASATFGKRKAALSISDSQKQIIDSLLPGVRKMFGYA